MRVGILGSGWTGGKLGTIFAQAGHDITGLSSDEGRSGTNG